MNNISNPLFETTEHSNSSSVPYQDKTCLHELLEKQAQNTPLKNALCFNEQTLTYLDLNVSANAIANILLLKGVTIEDFVIVYMERSLELIPAIFGVLKSGGVYVPVITSTPQNRIQNIIEDTKAKVIITNSSLVNKLPTNNCDIIYADEIINNIDDFDFSQPKVAVNSRNLAYAIFTSGTSGKPKGVLIEHHSVMNRIGWMQKKYPINSDDILIQKTPISFDVSIWELFWWTFVGAKLVLLENDYEKDPFRIIECIYKEKVSVIHFVPSMFNTFVMFLNNSPIYNISKIKSLKWLFCSGEELHAEPVLDFYKFCAQNNHSTTIVNLYGPTEATVDVTYHTCSCETKSPIPIGKPIYNTEIYIVNDNNEILPAGEQGELVICGVNLARGYLNRPEITKEKFISIIKPDGSAITGYKSGDYAYYDLNGELIYKGRIDGQIKLRGNRIELSEIENTVITYKGIGECACVLNNKNKDSAHIIAFFKSNETINTEELNTYINSTLPKYMVPSKYIPIEQLPLSANGKLDRNKLLDDYKNSLQVKCELKTISDYERALNKIWGQLFSNRKISPLENFFEMGGNSLLLVQTSLLIKKELNIEIDVIDLMQYPTIRLLAENISSRNNTLNNSIY